ncbi:folate-binding protein [Luteimonas aestuarii]|uniref:Folate-binding protein n=1 Tax=Luteimonas aestuarii TaxID=453837 RepID=A0A4R5TQ36_9GAMM|nr:folate-binding protein YgfZ [Luteimonas aestuarii]TDK21552.1 folate-binding protein [Luteimonas aestuarii]
MSDKQPIREGRFSAIPGIASLTLEGRDAVAFAQAQFMSDVAALAPGHWHWSGWLTPKGRVIALFALLKHVDDTLQVLLLDADPTAFAAQLQRYVFRSKVVVRVDAGVQPAGAFVAPVDASGSRFAAGDDGGLELDLGTALQPRTLRTGVAAASDDSAAQAWRQADLAHGLPRLPHAQADAWTPQQLSLERLKAFSVKKGCYPGQEIVARTHFLGQAKRGLVRLQGAGVASLGEVLPAEGERALGQLVCAAGDEALAVMPLEAGDGPFLTGGLPCRRVPLLDGLAR